MALLPPPPGADCHGWGGYTDIDLGKWPQLKRYVERIGARADVIEALRAEGLVK